MGESEYGAKQLWVKALLKVLAQLSSQETLNLYS